MADAFRFCVAPMFKVTNRHFRYLSRLISPNCELYTEMYVDKKLNHAPYELEDMIGGYPGESGTTIQLAGIDPEDLFKATKKVVDFGYRKVNLNCGCPSQKGVNHFGVTLMKDPKHVQAICSAMGEAIKETGESVELSVKCRNGVDDMDSYDLLYKFIESVSSSGVSTFIIHSRKAILSLNTRKNHDIPPINYNYAYQLIKDFPQLQFIINGEVRTATDIEIHRKEGVHGVMIGRLFQHNPWAIHEFEEFFFPTGIPLQKESILLQYNEYIKKEIQREKMRPNFCLRSLDFRLLHPIVTSYNGTSYAKSFRSSLNKSNVPLAKKIPTALRCVHNKLPQGVYVQVWILPSHYLSMGLLTIIRKVKEKEKELRILILGLDNAGKTTIVKKFNGEDISTVSPTLGFHIQTLEYHGYKLNIWDIGGQKSIRSYWRNYFEQSSALIWCVDSSDFERLDLCKQHLHELLLEEKLAGAPLLIFANKQDLETSASLEKIHQLLELDDLNLDRHWCIVACSAVTGEGLKEGIHWIVRELAGPEFDVHSTSVDKSLTSVDNLVTSVDNL